MNYTENEISKMSNLGKLILISPISQKIYIFICIKAGGHHANKRSKFEAGNSAENSQLREIVRDLSLQHF